MAERGAADLDTQRGEVEALLKTRLKKGDTWYLVDSHWFKQWKKYVGFDSWDKYQIGDQNVYPGPVDNSSLLGDADVLAIKEHLIDELDYILVPTEGWNKLVSWYGLTDNQEPIARKVVEQGMFVKHCKVEVYLTELKLCEDGNMDNVITRSFSKADTIDMIEKEMRKLFSITDENETRMWSRYMSNTFEPLNKPDRTIQDAGLYQGQVLVIEQKAEDGSWHRGSTAPKQGRTGTKDQPGKLDRPNLVPLVNCQRGGGYTLVNCPTGPLRYRPTGKTPGIPNGQSAPAYRTIMMSMRGQEQVEKRYDPRDTTLKFVKRKDDLDPVCDEDDGLRAEMSCGHAVTPDSLTQWCRSQLDDGYYKFRCPAVGEGTTQCNKLWSYQEVRRLADLSVEEMQYFEEAMSRLTAAEYCEIQTCPQCRTSVERKDLSNLCVQCSICTADLKKTYQFCWQCMKEWKGPGPRSDCCDNDGCMNGELQLLQTCKTLSLPAVEGVADCPSVRACPTCGMKVEHSQQYCKNIDCPRCRVAFCFVCLKLKSECCKTSSPYKICPSGVAPRQAAIPVWQKK